VRVGPIAGALFDGRIYWAQMETVNRARLVFPGVVDNNLSVPTAANLDIVGDLEIVVRCQVPAAGIATPAAAVGKGAPAAYAYAYGWMNDGRFLFLQAPASVPGSAAFATLTRPGGITAGSIIWMKVTRVRTTGVVTFYWAADSPTEPTSWTNAGSATPGTMVNVDACTSTQPLRVGQLAPTNSSGTAYAYPGRILRAIIRNGIAGTTVLDVNENDAYALTGTTFPATSGQTVTVNQTAGNTIVQPQPNTTVWRFDANDYPGTGLTYVDPRGRTWTLSAAGAIAGP
jgi:hypothetical protein